MASPNPRINPRFRLGISVMQAFRPLLFLLLISLSSPAKGAVTSSITGPNDSPTITNLGKEDTFRR